MLGILGSLATPFFYRERNNEESRARIQLIKQQIEDELAEIEEKLHEPSLLDAEEVQFHHHIVNIQNALSKMPGEVEKIKWWSNLYKITDTGLKAIEWTGYFLSGTAFLLNQLQQEEKENICSSTRICSATLITAAASIALFVKTANNFLKAGEKHKKLENSIEKIENSDFMNERFKKIFTTLQTLTKNMESIKTSQQASSNSGNTEVLTQEIKSFLITQAQEEEEERAKLVTNIQDKLESKERNELGLKRELHLLLLCKLLKNIDQDSNLIYTFNRLSESLKAIDACTEKGESPFAMAEQSPFSASGAVATARKIDPKKLIQEQVQAFERASGFALREFPLRGRMLSTARLTTLIRENEQYEN